MGFCGPPFGRGRVGGGSCLGGEDAAGDHEVDGGITGRRVPVLGGPVEELPPQEPHRPQATLPPPCRSQGAGPGRNTNPGRRAARRT